MSNIKKCFTSRFGNDGVIMEGDWSQLEVVAQAFLSGDEQMKQDIRDGVDFHCKRLAYKLKEPYTAVWEACHSKKIPVYVKMRKDIKTFSFQRAYGAMARSIAESTGMKLEEVKDLIKQEEDLYPQVAEYYKKVLREVELSRQPSSKRTARGVPAGVGYFDSITGRRYWFQEYDSPQFMIDNGKPTSFSMPQIQNYPVQGFATADLVPLMLGVLFRELNSYPGLDDSVLLINTVHDSILLDVRKDRIPIASRILHDTMIQADERLKSRFAIDFDLPLSAEVTWGPSWGEQKEMYKSS